MVERELLTTGRLLIDLSQDEILGFAGNSMEVKSEDGQEYLVMSLKASQALTSKNFNLLDACYQGKLIICDVDFIEQVGGGGIRCMMAGNFLP